MKQRPYWWDTVAPSVAAPPPLPHACEILVIGAGYTGLSAARRLALSGASVLVVERESVGWGASSRNGGQLLTGLKVEPATLVDRYGEHRARALFDAANAAIANVAALIREERIACDYRPCGHVQAAWKPAHFRAFREEQSLLARIFNHRVELVDASQQQAEIGSTAYHGLLVDEASGCLNPARYVHGLADAARRAGACVVSGVSVHGSTVDRGGTGVS